MDFNRPQRNNDGGLRNEKLSVFSQSARPFRDPGRGESFSRNDIEVAHWFVLNNYDEIMAYLDEHEEMMKREHPSHLYAKKHSELFPQWFLDSSVTIDLGDLLRYDVAVGPNNDDDVVIEEEDWETESDDSDDNKSYYSSDDE
ncbi:hypothetical protein L3X38_037004 [Prunus dulcis]|uniref:Uncharacterized protein n=1 Tax=Prunus dulcis TaxID=3755 RepID=A0AAD4V4M3_PRUDU|nr:hypothetical protein L3X38_037004 [Prunus dulcis]